MSQHDLYIKQKEKTERVLYDINKLESQIDQVQSAISAKRHSISSIKAKQLSQKRAIQHFASLKKALQQEKDENSPITSKQRNQHDLTQLLASPDAICKKIEYMIEKQTETTLTNPELSSLSLKIEEMHKHNKYKFSDIEGLINAAHDLLLKEQRSTDELDNGSNIEDMQERIQQLEEEQKERLAHVRHLFNKKYNLVAETKKAEYNLLKRINELHSDPDVREALFENLRRKSQGHQLYIELTVMEREADELYKQYESSKNQSENGDDDDIAKAYAGPQEMANALESLKEAQKKALELMVTNEHYVKHLNQQHSDGNAYLSEETQYLLNRLETTKAQLLASSNRPNDTHTIDTSKEEGYLKELKNKLSPFTNISTARTISELGTLILKLKQQDQLTEYPNIPVLLKSLVDKWIQEDCSPTEINNVDDIKAFINSVTNEMENSNSEYISKQMENLNKKLASTASIQKEVDRTKEALKDRQLLVDVGHDYTVQDLTFKQWLDKL